MTEAQTAAAIKQSKKWFESSKHLLASGGEAMSSKQAEMFIMLTRMEGEPADDPEVQAFRDGLIESIQGAFLYRIGKTRFRPDVYPGVDITPECQGFLISMIDNVGMYVTLRTIMWYYDLKSLSDISHHLICNGLPSQATFQGIWDAQKGIGGGDNMIDNIGFLIETKNAA